MTQQRTLDGPASDASATVLTWRTSVTQHAAPVDLLAAERAATDLLRALGQPIESDGMAETPRRMAHAYAEMLTSDNFDFTTFPNAEGYDELVVVEDIPVRSVCEHHMLPFVGVAHLGYLPADRILGLSKLARLVELYAHRAQTQERLTQQIAEHLDQHLAPRGCRGRDRGRAHLHEPARGPHRRHPHRHLGTARHTAHRPRLTSRVPLPDPRRRAGVPLVTTPQTFVIVGGGLAAGKAVAGASGERLRRTHSALRRGGAPAVRTAAPLEGLPDG